LSSYSDDGLEGDEGDSNDDLRLRDNTIDDIGVVVVDGNFDLYGKIIFGNKKILRVLGYQGEDVLGKTVHCLMPRMISDVHN
jgi:PAS domain S-box-containing protein